MGHQVYLQLGGIMMALCFAIATVLQFDLRARLQRSPAFSILLAGGLAIVFLVSVRDDGELEYGPTVFELQKRAVGEGAVWGRTGGDDPMEDGAQNSDDDQNGGFSETRAKIWGDGSAAARAALGEKDCDACPEMIPVPPGSASIGFPVAAVSNDAVSLPISEVRFSTGFAASQSEITRGDYAAFMQATGYVPATTCIAKGQSVAITTSVATLKRSGDAPVTCVTWSDATAYAAWLSEKAGRAYRNLTEAEWEYVAAVNDGRDVPKTPRGTESVSYKNVFTGLSGRAAEWVEDCFAQPASGHSAYGDAALVDAGGCALRTIKGGSWSSSSLGRSDGTRNAQPGHQASDQIGIRVMRVD